VVSCEDGSTINASVSVNEMSRMFSGAAPAGFILKVDLINEDLKKSRTFTSIGRATGTFLTATKEKSPAEVRHVISSRRCMPDESLSVV